MGCVLIRRREVVGKSWELTEVSVLSNLSHAHTTESHTLQTHVRNSVRSTTVCKALTWTFSCPAIFNTDQLTHHHQTRTPPSCYILYPQQQSSQIVSLLDSLPLTPVPKLRCGSSASTEYFAYRSIGSPLTRKVCNHSFPRFTTFSTRGPTLHYITISLTICVL